MQFQFTAIVHHNTSIIKITEQIEADDSEHALLLIKALHAENLVEVISLDTCAEPAKNQIEDLFVRSPTCSANTWDDQMNKSPSNHDSPYTALE